MHDRYNSVCVESDVKRERAMVDVEEDFESESDEYISEWLIVDIIYQRAIARKYIARNIDERNLLCRTVGINV